MLACGVRGAAFADLCVRDPDEPQRGVSGWRQQLAFERQQALADDVRLGRIELTREALEALALIGDQVDLHRGGFADASACHDQYS